MKKNSLMVFKIISVLALIVSFAVAFQVFAPKELSSIPTLPELSTVGYVKVTPEAAVIENRGVISLTGGCYQVIASTDVTQAESIINGLEGKINVRPNTHDLMKDMFQNLGIEVVIVKVVDLKDNNFIGRIILKQGNKILSLDSKPSDGIAIAVRTNAPIYMNRDLMEKMGKYICQ